MRGESLSEEPAPQAGDCFQAVITGQLRPVLIEAVEAEGFGGEAGRLLLAEGDHDLPAVCIADHS